MEEKPNNNPIENNPNPAPASEATEASHPEDRILITPLRTYADDVKRAIETDSVSMIKIAMAEAQKRERESDEFEETSPASHKNVLIIGISFALVVIGALSIGGVWYYSQLQNNKLPTVVVRDVALLPYDQESPIKISHGDKQEILDGINLARTNKYEKDTSFISLPMFRQIGTTTAPLITSDLLSLFSSRASDSLVRSLDPRFMFGLSVHNGLQPFLVLRTDSFNTAYAGMLDWETKMTDDIGDLFFTKAEMLDGATTTVTIADSLQFKDEIVNNKDVRSVRTKSGKLLMYYSFVNDKLLLLGKDFETIDEVSKRLATSQFKQ